MRSARPNKPCGIMIAQYHVAAAKRNEVPVTANPGQPTCPMTKQSKQGDMHTDASVCAIQVEQVRRFVSESDDVDVNHHLSNEMATSTASGPTYPPEKRSIRWTAALAS